MKMFFELLLAFFFCSVLTNGHDTDECANKYMVYNSYENINQMNVSCYSTSSCSLLYFPQGETVDSVDLGTIPAGETTLIEAEVAQYGRLYSNCQIGVSTNNILVPDSEVVVLPRGSDAGTHFNFLVSYIGIRLDFLLTCAFSAINKPANVSFEYGSGIVEYILNPYSSNSGFISFQNAENMAVRITSNATIIATCYDVRSRIFHTLQPALNEPVFTFAEDHYATILLSDCQTNEPISDFSKVKVEYAGVDDDSCTLYSTISPNDSVLGKNCGFLVTPNDENTCISITKQHATGVLTDTGYPESKRILQVYQMPIFSSSLYSFSCAANNCKLSSNSVPVSPNSQETLSGSLKTGVFVDTFGGNQLDELGDISCVEPAFIYRSGEIFSSLQRYGLQSEDAWKPFFATIKCSTTTTTSTPTPTTTSTPTITIFSGTQPEIFFSASTWIAIICIWLCFTSA